MLMLSIHPRNWKSDEDRRLFGYSGREKSNTCQTARKEKNLTAHQDHVARHPKDAQSSTHLAKRSA